MTTTAEKEAFGRGVWPVAELVFPEKAAAVLGFRPSPELQARIEELADKSTERRLTQTERAEYEGYIRANKFIAILQRLAREVGHQTA